MQSVFQYAAQNPLHNMNVQSIIWQGCLASIILYPQPAII